MQAMQSRYRFDPRRHRAELVPLLAALAEAPTLAGSRRDRLLARHPKEGKGFFSKSELLAGLRWLRRAEPAALAGVDLARLERRLRGKPVRTLSGVAVVTVFTRPHPCPGRCVFCPNDVRMPKSYLADEPGCQRALTHRFDPYEQTWSRLRALAATGHTVDKVELLVLGGTWSSYPADYQAHFLERCFAAMNDFGAAPTEVRDEVRGPGSRAEGDGASATPPPGTLDGRQLHRGADGAGRSYNSLVGRGGDGRDGSAGSSGGTDGTAEEAGDALDRMQAVNEGAGARCVGLVLETRPDRVDAGEVLRLRRLGATKVQLGVQSLSDRVLAANRRGHGVDATRRSFRLLRAAGFKIQAHWMANLLGSDPAADVADFRRLFADPDFRPDELKIYPCSLVENAELMRFWEAGEWRPYGDGELLEVVIAALAATPGWCRLSRVIRDIPGTDIVAGSRVTNLRQVAEAEMARRGLAPRDVRAREVRGGEVDPKRLRLTEEIYATSVGEERFVQLLTPEDELAGFLRLSLPEPGRALAGSAGELRRELASRAVIREVHVYGRVAPLVREGRSRNRAQHRGLGRRLVEHAAAAARGAGHGGLAVISAVGTRRYYRRLGFADGALYQHLTW